MPTSQKNNPQAIDANPSLDNAGLSIAPSMSGSNIAGAAYSPTADSDQSVSGSTNSPVSKNVNAQMVTHLYSRASQWISKNPALAIGAAVGIVAAVVGIVVASQSTRRSSNFQSRYPTGPTDGNVYGSGSSTLNPSMQTDSVDRESNYTSSDSDSFAGYDRPIGEE